MFLEITLWVVGTKRGSQWQPVWLWALQVPLMMMTLGLKSDWKENDTPCPKQKGSWSGHTGRTYPRELGNFIRISSIFQLSTPSRCTKQRWGMEKGAWEQRDLACLTSSPLCTGAALGPLPRRRGQMPGRPGAK